MVQVLSLHSVAFVIGHKIGEVVGEGSPALAHTLSLQTGMQVSLHSLWAMGRSLLCALHSGC